MAQFLDTTGLQTLWNKIKDTFAPQNWLMVDLSDKYSLKLNSYSGVCTANLITYGSIGFYRDVSTNVSGETTYGLYVLISTSLNGRPVNYSDLTSCPCKLGTALQKMLDDLINTGAVEENNDGSSNVKGLLKVLKFSDSEYLTLMKPDENAVGVTKWVFFDNFNDALSALLSGGADVVSS